MEKNITYAEINTIKSKYPGRVPIFVTKAPNSKDIPDISKKKFLAPSTLTLGQFIFIIRKQIQLPPEKALFIFVNNTLPPSSTLLSDIYANDKSQDGVLRMVYTSETTYGF
jgi:GABA(A) receptor-associated protein